MLLYNIYGFCQSVKLRWAISSNSVSHKYGKHVKQMFFADYIIVFGILFIYIDVNHWT